jgi:hypothetical protein
VSAATHGHFHISTDGWKSYPAAIRRQLGHRADHGVMNKIYGRPIDFPFQAYAPVRIIGAARTPSYVRRVLLASAKRIASRK